MDFAKEPFELEPDYSDSIFLDQTELKTDSIESFDRMGDTFTGVPGRLLRKSEFYLEVNASQYNVDTVTDGYKLIFKNDTTPPLFSDVITDQPDFVLQELRHLESLGCIKSVSSSPQIVNLVSCVYSKNGD